MLGICCSQANMIYNEQRDHEQTYNLQPDSYMNSPVHQIEVVHKSDDDRKGNDQHEAHW
jgi:hypothetical protein